MKIGYEISSSPASVAFFACIERQMNRLATLKAKTAARVIAIAERLEVSVAISVRMVVQAEMVAKMMVPTSICPARKVAVEILLERARSARV